ncbi:hypothetical protein N9297_04185 [Candidatus Pelagibacter sp.]|nr:hypothetical protein [Candidatus Pelagibacter sp.]
MNNLLIFIFYYVLILFSIIGYGFFFLRLCKLDKRLENIGYIGIFGIFFLIIYSYLSNFFVAHAEIHNVLIILFGLLNFIFSVRKFNFKYKNQFFFIFAVFFLLVLGLFQFKNHDDFPYYHFPYTYYLTQQSLHFGIGQFNHGFRTPSSIFYLNSLFYLPFAKFYLFNFSSAFILGFTNIILLEKIHHFFSFTKIKKRQISLINYLSLLSFIFINIFFYRLAEYGTDRAAMILIFLLIIEIFNFHEVKKFKSSDLLYIYVLGAIIISLKTFYILYLIFFIPLLILILKEKKSYFRTLHFLLYNKYFLLLLLLLLFVLITSFINTGCIIYPLSLTCFDTLSWGLPSAQVQKMNAWYELWSKGGAAPNFRVENPVEYVKGFNWLSNWTHIYFFNKMSDFILGILFLISIVLFLFKESFFNIRLNKIKTGTYIVYFIIFILGLEWFYNRPSLRYGGYHILPLLLFIPISIKLASTDISIKKYTKIILILICITTSTFIGRNISRVIKEVQVYDYKPFKKTFYFIDENHFRIQKQMDKKIKKHNDCSVIVNKCDSDIKIIMGKIIFTNK